MKAIIGFMGTIIMISALLACQGSGQAEKTEPDAKVDMNAAQEEIMPEIKVSSKAFIHEGMIPARYTCDGEDISPEIMWKNIPEKAKSLALICDDPDAPSKTWIHWVVYNIPACDTCLPADIKPQYEGFIQGENDWQRIGYGGPCPPGGVHRYFFKLYALDCELDLKKGATKSELLKAMEGHILAQGELMGKYQRQR